MRVFMLVPAVAALFAAQLPAQDTTELLNRMKAMEDRIRALEARCGRSRLSHRARLPWQLRPRLPRCRRPRLKPPRKAPHPVRR
jgi:hypothetical protein